MDIEEESKLIVFIQKALLGAINADLRGILIDTDKKDVVKIWFVNDGEITDDLLKCWNEVINKIRLYLPSSTKLESYFEQINYPQKIATSGGYIYLRKEKNI